MTLPSDLLGTVYLVIALSGVLVAVLGWRGTRPGRRRWCPQCGHDLSETESRTCPGCGYSSPEERDFQRPRRRWWVVIVGLVVVATASGFAVGTGAAQATGRLIGPAWTTLESKSLPNGWVADHAISADLERTVFNRRIRVRQGGVVHFQWSGRSSELGFPVTGSRIAGGLGTDVDRDGEPDLVVGVSEAGNASPRTWLLISLASRSAGARLEPKAVLRDGWFRDVDGDERVEFVASDSSLLERWAEYGALPVPDVVLSPASDGWRFDRKATARRPLPDAYAGTPEEIIAAAVVDWEAEETPFVSRLFGLAAALAARDRGDEALAVVRATWPGDDDPARVAGMTTITEPDTQLPRPYRPDPIARERDLRDLLERWRWSDLLPLPSG